MKSSNMQQSTIKVIQQSISLYYSRGTGELSKKQGKLFDFIDRVIRQNQAGMR
jgi:hypothetical protein